MFRSSLIVILCVTSTLAFSQSADTTISQVNRKGLRIAIGSASLLYGASLIGLNELWYKNSPRQSFEFFNDIPEWKQVDKLGHFYSSFYLSYGTSRALQHFNVPASKADLAGAITGFAALLPIEIFDGFSEAYGASVGDIIADGAGSLFYLGQQKLWSEVRIIPRFSFHATPYSKVRPALLGEDHERIIKDYNGQTYWLSVDVDKFVRFPKWLNIAAGYGAEGMIYAREHQHPENGYRLPYRQLYISLDPDLSFINSRSKVVRTLLFVASMIKVPSPALEFSSRGIRFHPLYF